MKMGLKLSTERHFSWSRRLEFLIYQSCIYFILGLTKDKTTAGMKCVKCICISKSYWSRLHCLWYLHSKYKSKTWCINSEKYSHNLIIL